MIKQLKIKLITLCMVSLFVLLAVTVAGMNAINYRSVISEADTVLELLGENMGTFPEFRDDGKGDIGNRLPPDMSPEIPYESRFFSVLFNSNEDIIQVETGRIASVDSSDAIDYAQEALANKSDKGFVEKFRFVKTAENDTVRVTFLDCGRKLDAFYAFLLASAGMALMGYIIVFFIIFFLSGRIIRPIAESYEKQKRFITDAGHEIKTPLTIINANADVLEMELGENECVADIQQQAKRLASLTNDLVCLARMEEDDSSLQMIEFPVSDLVQETAAAFRTPAQNRNIDFSLDIVPLLSMKGNAKAVAQLITLLMDNALKYTPDGGKISLSLAKQNKNTIITVFNTTREHISPQQLNKVFDRFYRTDSSRNSETGGHGIGLSVAKAIVKAHGGKINAVTEDGYSFTVTAIL